MFYTEENLHLITKTYNLSNENISDFYELLLRDNSKKEQYQIFTDDLNKKQWRIKDTSVSNRTLNHWLNEEIILDTRIDGKGWNHFSTLELTWIRTIERLRAYGYPIENLKKIKKSLTQHSDIINSPYPILEFGIYKYSKLRLNTYLVVNEKGDCTIADNMIGTEDFLTNPNLATFDSFLAIKLREVVEIAERGIAVIPPNEAEQTLLEKLTQNLSYDEIEEVRIKYNQDGPHQIEVLQKTSPDRKVHDLVAQYPYQEISLKVHKGEINSILRIIKEKIRK